MKLRLIKNNEYTTISGSSLEDLNYQKNILELENAYLYDVCCFGNDDLPLPTTYFKLAPKTIKVFKTKTIKIRNDFEQWCDVQGVEQTGGSDNELSTIVSHYNIQRNDDIVKDYFNFIPLTIFTPDNWYCNSVEFNAISQYYKGNHDTFAKEQWNAWYQHEGKELITKEELDYLPFVNFIKRLGFNYE
tara:strand:- start:1788 stop:2351 length:564 start_codon:yes stop_codon:yes gene_type:complete